MYSIVNNTNVYPVQSLTVNCKEILFSKKHRGRKRLMRTPANRHALFEFQIQKKSSIFKLNSIPCRTKIKAIC